MVLYIIKFVKLNMLASMARGLDSLDCAGWSPLHVACFMGRQEVVQELLRSKASVSGEQSAWELSTDGGVERSSVDVPSRLSKGVYSSVWHRSAVRTLPHGSCFCKMRRRSLCCRSRPTWRTRSWRMSREALKPFDEPDMLGEASRISGWGIL